MVQFRDIPIKRKLTAIILVASTVAFLLVSGGFVAYELFTYQRTMKRDLATLADIIGDRSAAALLYDIDTDAQETLQALAKNEHIVAAALYKNDGQLLAHYSAGEVDRRLFPQWPERTGARFEQDHLILFHEIRTKGDPSGTLYLKSDLRQIRERFKGYAAIIFVLLILSTAATYFLAALLQRIISRPVFHLAETARAVSVEKNYAVRAAKHGNDELGQFTDVFNEMLEQIQQRDAALQQAHDQLETHVQERTKDLEAEIVERRRAESALKQQFMRISLLNRITQVISERQDTESILHVVLRQLEDHLSLDLGTVALFDTQAETLNVAALRVKNPRLTTKLDLHEGTVLAFGDTGLKECHEGQTVYLADTLKNRVALAEKLACAGLRSAVAVPLLVEDKLFGVLLAARLKPEGFSSGECEFLRMLSEHVALAAHQARLHDELEHAYNELRQTQQAVMQQERLKALGQMASGIAHDVNNALSPVVGFADLILRGEHGLSGTGKKYLQYIKTAGEDIAHIVARLREFYRQREDTGSLRKLNLNLLADEVVDMTRPRWRDIPQSRGTTVEVQTDYAPDVPELVGIESEVREALTNLVLNAVDALPNGGKIAIRTRVAKCDAAQSGARHPAHVMLEVSDTGVGMSEATRKHCLEPFFSTKGRRGTGLGLAMVYGVMERHEGRIEIQSELGQGTTFRLIFPVRAAVGAAAEAEVNNAPQAPLQILCIDDEPLLRELLKELLERDGHTVEVSDSGQSGLDAFRLARDRGQSFDLVITDLGMPYVDGRQVAKKIKSESPATPVVMLTGWGALMKDGDTMPAEVDGVLCKPPRSRELREILQRLSKGRNGSPR